MEKLMKLELVAETDEILHQTTELFDFENPSLNIADLTDAMYQFMIPNNGIGLAAPQVGYSVRAFVLADVDQKNEKIVCVNPVILESSEQTSLMKEGCLSYPFLALNVKRPHEIRVEYQMEDGTRIIRWMSGLLARCYQHELDHLDGITFHDRVSKLGLKLAEERRRKLQKKAR